jgi:Zn-finger nucleic acid-binding protein/ribosomal protein L40E
VLLVACGNCRTQYDVTEVVEKTFPCRCGEILANEPPGPGDAQVLRCESCGALTAAEAESCEYCTSAIVRDATQLLSLICPECYARNAEDSRFCTACGITFRPEAVHVDGHELPCPLCSALMPPRQIGGVGVNECGSCGGLWVPGQNFDLLVSRSLEARKQADPAELSKLQPRVTGSNPAAQKVQYRSCPECGAYMHRRNFRKSSGVIIDRCSQHGTWLDVDELEQIAGYLLSGRETPKSLRVETGAQRPAASGFAQLHRLSGRERPREGGFVDSAVELLFALLK